MAKGRNYFGSTNRKFHPQRNKLVITHHTLWNGLEKLWNETEVFTNKPPKSILNYIDNLGHGSMEFPWRKLQPGYNWTTSQRHSGTQYNPPSEIRKF